MTTRRELILQTLVSKLSTGNATPVYRSRVEPFTRAESPAIVVEPVNDNATQTTIGRLDWTLTVRVMVIVRGDIPDQIADPIVQDIHSRLMADLFVGGYAYDLQPQSTSFELLESDMPTGVISLDYAVLYKTNLLNLATV